jgi:hypothetical protein
MANIITAGNSTNGGTAISTDTSGTLNIVTGSGSGANAITIDASQNVTMAGNVTASGTLAVTGAQTIGGNLTVTGTLSATGGVTGSITRATAVASTSGTSIDFTGIPSGVKRITVMLYDVSTTGSSPPQIQIGSGSFTTSGYTAIGQNGTTIQNSTTGFITTGSWAGTSIKSGSIVLTNITGNAWVASGVSVDIPPGAGNASYCAGRVTLGGTLDRVRITTVNGTDTFDLGSINILYE